MSKKYHMDSNNTAFLHCVNSAFAGIDYIMQELENSKEPKKRMLRALKETMRQMNTAICSEYIRGELIKKGVLDNSDNDLLCVFDPTDNNKDNEAEVYTQDELLAIRNENASTSS